MSLALLTLSLLNAPPAQAQSGYPGGGGSGGYPGGGGGYPGSGWNVVNPSSTPLVPISQSNDGSYPLAGQMTGSASHPGYPATQGYQAYAPTEQDSLYSFLYTGGIQPVPFYGSNGISVNAAAGNFAANGNGGNGAYGVVGGSYWMPGSPYADLIGTMTATGDGQIGALWQWTGSGQPPDHIDLLLRTSVQASVNVSYGQSTQITGLTSTATASDGSPFNETASVSTDPFGVIGIPSVLGFHLLRVPVQGGAALVTLGGHVTANSANTLPYGARSASPSSSYDYYLPTNGNTSAIGSASVSAVVSLDSREVTINFPAIETSYYKGVVDAQHPTGQWPHIRSVSDGSLIGDSAVLGTVAGHWKNGVGTSTSFSANTPGFTNPYYLWSKTGPGTPDAQTGSNLGVSEQFLAAIPMNLDFGTEPSVTSDPNTVVANNPFPLSIVVRTDVTDGPGTDGATAANTYTVTYHLPFENPVKYGPETKDDTFEMQTLNLAINTLPIEPIPVKVEAVDLADGAHIAGGVATAVSAGLPLIKLGADVAEPDLIVAQTVFAVFGYALGLAPDATPQTDPVPVATNYAEFCADVHHQVLINQQPVGQQDMVRFSPPQLAETVAAQLQQDPANWQQDPYFYFDPLQSHLTVSAKIYRHAMKQAVQGDGYGLNGYQGPKYHSVRAEGDFYNVTQWVYTGPTH